MTEISKIKTHGQPQKYTLSEKIEHFFLPLDDANSAQTPLFRKNTALTHTHSKKSSTFSNSDNSKQPNHVTFQQSPHSLTKKHSSIQQVHVLHLRQSQKRLEKSLDMENELMEENYKTKSRFVLRNTFDFGLKKYFQNIAYKVSTHLRCRGYKFQEDPKLLKEKKESEMRKANLARQKLDHVKMMTLNSCRSHHREISNHHTLTEHRNLDNEKNMISNLASLKTSSNEYTLSKLDISRISNTTSMPMLLRKQSSFILPSLSGQQSNHSRTGSDEFRSPWRVVNRPSFQLRGSTYKSKMRKKHRGQQTVNYKEQLWVRNS